MCAPQVSAGCAAHHVVRLQLLWGALGAVVYVRRANAGWAKTGPAGDSGGGRQDGGAKRKAWVGGL